MTQTTGAENSTAQSNPFLFRGNESSNQQTTGTVRVEKTESVEDQGIGVDPTITEYEKITRVPYTAKFFDLDKNFDDLSTSDKRSIKKIDDYLVSKIKSGEYPDDIKSGQAMIKQIMDQIKLTKEHDSYFKIDKISEYMGVIKDPLDLKRQQKKEKRSLKINLTKAQKEAEELSIKIDKKTRRENRLKQQVAIQEAKNKTLKKAFSKLLEAI